MNIKELLLSGANVSIVVTPADLKEFAVSLIQETLAMKPEEKPAEQYLSPDETATLLKVSKNTLWRWSKSGYLSPIKVGRKSVYTLSEINQIRQ